MDCDYSINTRGGPVLAYSTVAERIRVAATCSPLVKYQLLETIKHIVQDLRRGSVVFDADELIPKMLAVGRTRGTPEFERAVRDLLATLAKRIPSSKYGEDVEEYI